ncbi:MAG: hypothetical protein WDO56_20955 [Gammaproteobacteria bacterium]
MRTLLGPHVYRKGLPRAVGFVLVRIIESTQGVRAPAQEAGPAPVQVDASGLKAFSVGLVKSRQPTLGA